MINLLDCTLRDGGYVNNWKFTKKQVSDCYKACDEAGVEYIEVGFRNIVNSQSLQKYGETYFCKEEFLNENIQDLGRCKVAVMVTINAFDINDFVPKSESKISLVRVLMAYHGFKNKTDDQLDLQTLEDGINQINQLDSLGYETSFNIGRIDKLSREQLGVVCEKISKTNVKYFYMADTYGSVDMSYIDYLIPYVKELLNGTSIQIGFHTHDNYSDATTKALYSIKHGVNIIDGCSLGYGRGSGNAKTEVLMMYLNKHYYKEYEFIPIIEFGDKNLIHYKEKNSYNAVYALCAHLGCHVTYGIEIIENYPTLNIRDIFLTLVTIKSMKKHMFFYEKLFMETYSEIKQLNY